MPPGTPSAEPCIFCDIVAHRAPAYLVYEDAEAIAFLDIFPFTRGHLLVVPRHHVPRLTDLAPEEHAPYIRALATICRRAERLSPDYNVTLNQGAAAGQIVFHLHFHVIPRYGEANPFTPSARRRLSEEEARALVAELSPP
ncbi:MAG: HIT domain-containing protein [Thermoplasmata archaeon]|nr:HIT domain-containing protein [Thermoplasmata archaeon]